MFPKETDDMQQGVNLPRRAVLKGLMAGVGAAGFSSSPAIALAEAPATTYPGIASSAGDSITASEDQSVVETGSGKVRGYTRNGVHTFKGIPYANATTGALRFMPPAKPNAWTGIRCSMQYGNVCPQPDRTNWQNDEEAWLFSWNDGIPGEDCLRVNIWSQGLKDGKKRPVMVWLHGGGFTAGSGQELLSYDGENLARRGDVVVVTLNHRLNIFGYLDLSACGSRYENSANIGMLDIVAALEWVRDNIAGFGGDPNCVTIFGQSGGGSKVCTLLAMPSAKGLFHHAIVQSGSMQRARTPEQAAELTAAVMKQLQLDNASVEKIRDIPAAQLVAAAVAVTSKNRPAGHVIDYRHMAATMQWGPVMDGKVLPQHPFDPQTPAISTDVPLMVGSTLNEFTTAINHPELPAMTKADMITNLQTAFGGKWDAMRLAARKVYPNATPFDVWSIAASSSQRGAALTQAQSKAAANGAPAYCYLFSWQTPVLNGRLMACHCSEIAFAFANTDRCENMTGGGPGARDLADKVSDAWIHFAHTGNPNHPGLPHWPALTTATNATMIFDTHCVVKSNFDDGIHQVLSAPDKPSGA